MNSFSKDVIGAIGKPLSAKKITTIQVNVGLRCNLDCKHCHLEAGPSRTEEMSWATMETIIEKTEGVAGLTFDITGGSPELNPHLKRFIETLHKRGNHIMVRTNLAILDSKGAADFIDFYRENSVELVASMPCYLEENVDTQRGDGTYGKSIRTLKKLNSIGYGIKPGLPLSLVFNPGGPALPPDQEMLEEAYRQKLAEEHSIVFTRLLTITNMPIGRFFTDLERADKSKGYMALLRGGFNPATVPGLMCVHQINIRWDGQLFDCDFNQALDLPVSSQDPSTQDPLTVEQLDLEALENRQIVVGPHCYGCTAGAGSSCGGALLEDEDQREIA